MEGSGHRGQRDVLRPAYTDDDDDDDDDFRNMSCILKSFKQ